MVTLHPQYDCVELYHTLGSGNAIGFLSNGEVCLLLETRASIGARILTPSGLTGWLSMGWLQPISTADVANLTEKKL